MWYLCLWWVIGDEINVVMRNYFDIVGTILNTLISIYYL